MSAFSMSMCCQRLAHDPIPLLMHHEEVKLLLSLRLDMLAFLTVRLKEIRSIQHCCGEELASARAVKCTGACKVCCQRLASNACYQKLACLVGTCHDTILSESRVAAFSAHLIIRRPFLVAPLQIPSAHRTWMHYCLRGSNKPS